MNERTIYVTRGVGLLTLFMFMTLNADNGKDLLDVVVAYIQAVTPTL
jgi:hypothetical protein